MKNTKWTAQELLDTFNRETNNEEINELYKALIAYELGATEIDNYKLDKVINFYYSKDYITTFVNEDVMEYANTLLQDGVDFIEKIEM